MKLNKNGFTLIELLAVIVILLAISVIAISSISSAIERNKKKQNDSKIAVIVNVAESYYDFHKNTENDGCIELSQLNLTDSERVDANGNPFSGVITYQINGNNATNFSFNTSIHNCG